MKTTLRLVLNSQKVYLGEMYKRGLTLIAIIFSFSLCSSLALSEEAEMQTGFSDAPPESLKP